MAGKQIGFIKNGRPYIRVTLYSPDKAKTIPVDALVDTGAQFSSAHPDTIKALGSRYVREQPMLGHNNHEYDAPVYSVNFCFTDGRANCFFDGDTTASQAIESDAVIGMDIIMALHLSMDGGVPTVSW